MSIGALVTAISGWYEAHRAQGMADNVGVLATDLAEDPEADHLYEAVRVHLDDLRARTEYLSRRLEDVTHRVDGLHGVRVARDRVEDDAPSKPAPAVKITDLPAVRKARARRAMMVEQVEAR